MNYLSKLQARQKIYLSQEIQPKFHITQILKTKLKQLIIQDWDNILTKWQKPNPFKTTNQEL